MPGVQGYLRGSTALSQGHSAQELGMECGMNCGVSVLSLLRDQGPEQQVCLEHRNKREEKESTRQRSWLRHHRTLAKGTEDHPLPTFP